MNSEVQTLIFNLSAFLCQFLGEELLFSLLRTRLFDMTENINMLSFSAQLLLLSKARVTQEKIFNRKKTQGENS